jgi:hypothetical protein
MTKKTVVAVALIVALMFGAVTPSRAYATNTAVIIAGSIVAFVAFVIVGTLLTTHRNVPLFLQDTPPEDLDQPAGSQQGKVRFGTHCRPTAEGQPVLCW